MIEKIKGAKRFLITELFHTKREFNVSEWMDAQKELPKGNSGIYKVKLDTSDEIRAYYYCDGLIGVLYKFNLMLKDPIKPTYWWSYPSRDPLYNVTHWGKEDVHEDNV